MSTSDTLCAENDQEPSHTDAILKYLDWQQRQMRLCEERRERRKHKRERQLESAA